MEGDARPLVLHVMYRFDTGGLENGVVNLINHMPAHAYRHAVLALTEVTEFRQRVQRHDVEFISLHKPPGHGVWQYPELFKLFRRLRPAIVHSRNLAALEVQVPAWAAGVPVRIHGEHGRDVEDLDGSNVTYQRVQATSTALSFITTWPCRVIWPDYLTEQRCMSGQRPLRKPTTGSTRSAFPRRLRWPQPIAGCPFNPDKHWLLGTVGRMQTVKDQVDASACFCTGPLALAPELQSRLRLVMVGDGPLRAQAQAALEAAGVAHLTWLPGERSDVGDIMRGLHAFALPSLAEGISNTILEAMASGLPVVATDVGGNADLVVQGETGCIVSKANPLAMAQQLVALASTPERARSMGEAGRQRVLDKFSMQAMVSTYQRVYDQQLRRVGFIQ
jgi:sugar transferase (PEP-CTERM/EpsH1 system associated)